MNIIKHVCRVLAVVGLLALAVDPGTSGDRVNEVCVVAADIDYCAPKDV